MIAVRILEPASKLATARALDRATCHSSLGQRWQLEKVSENDLYAALDWLGPRQTAIETALAKRHLSEDPLVLYDVTSTYFEGRTCPWRSLATPAMSAAASPGSWSGWCRTSTAVRWPWRCLRATRRTPKRWPPQLDKLRRRFGFQQLVLVGDRGLVTHKRIDDELRPLQGVAWITALRALRIRTLADAEVLRMSLFDERDLAELSHPNFPGERLLACRNPLLAEERRASGKS